MRTYMLDSMLFTCMFDEELTKKYLIEIYTRLPSMKRENETYE